MNNTQYRLAQVRVEHFERIEVVDVIPESDLTLISGANTQGKSSFLHFIQTLFEGKGSRSTVPIKEGHPTGGGFVVLAADGKKEFTVELELRVGKPDRLVVRDAEGNPTAKGQEWLKSLIGRGLAFDPSEFDDPPGAKTKDARDKLRLEMLLRVAPIGIDLAAAKTKREDFYARRTIANRDKETASAKLLTLAKLEVPEVVDLAAKRAELSAARATNDAIRITQDRIGRIDERLAVLRKEFEEMKANRTTLVAALEVGKHVVVDCAALDNEVAAGERTNVERERILAGNARYDEALAELGKQKKLSDEMTASMEAIDKQKAEALAAAKFPVAGLSVSETEVRFNGLPYEQASDAERLEIAFAVTAADKPQLALALIDVGERFDTAGVERVRGIAERMGIQVLMARRSPDVERRVELVDGRVAEPAKS